MFIRLNGLSGWLAAILLSAACLAATPDSRVAEAAKHQNKAAVRTLVAERADVNGPEADGATALQWAAHWDDLETADLLIQAGANVNAANELGVTPLALACENGSAPIVGKLLQAGAKVNLAPLNGETPLMTCARAGGVDAVKALLAHGADVNAKENVEGQSALMWAVAEGHPDVVRVLIEHGADVRARSRTFGQLIVRDESGARLVCPPPPGVNAPCVNAETVEKGGSTPLLFAARSGDVESAKLLVAAGANVNDEAPDGNSALVIAAYSGHGKLAEFLLDKDANPSADKGGYSALHAALLRGDNDLVKSLLAHGANPNTRMTKGTPHMRSSQQFVLPESLVGATPFFLAAKYAEPEMMRALAAAGADPLVPARDGTTPLMAAAGVGYRGGETRTSREYHRVPPPDDDRTLEAVKVALSFGADVNAANQAGNTALHGAASKAYADVIKLLVEKGAKLDVRNKRGETPLTLASAEPNKVYAERDRRPTRALLLQLGAKDAGNVPQPPKNLKVLADASDVRPTMAQFTSGLGVQCAFCHVQDRSSDENPKKQIARMMLTMVNEINAKFPDHKAHISCYTCHRGENEPKIEPAATASVQ
jgi:ankyrin repeat protein